MLPAGFPSMSFSLTSDRDVHFASGGKANLAASSIIDQSSRNLTGHVITHSPLWRMLQTPNESCALSFVQLGTMLLKGHSLFILKLLAFLLWLDIGKPKTSARGLLLIAPRLAKVNLFGSHLQNISNVKKITCLRLGEDFRGRELIFEEGVCLVAHHEKTDIDRKDFLKMRQVIF